MSPSSKIPHAFYPHIIESIVSYTDYKTKLQCRATCRALQQYTDKLLITDVLCVTVGPDGWAKVTPYSGELYPFFKPEGDRPAQIQAIKRSKKILEVENVNASPFNRIINEVGPLAGVSLNHGSCHANYQVPSFVKGYSSLDVYPKWDCSCNEENFLQPALHHTARCLSIEFGTDEHYDFSTDEYDYSNVEDVIIQEGSSSGCHLLSYALNKSTTLVDILIHFPISVSSLKHLPRYLLPNGHKVDLNPELKVQTELNVRSLDRPSDREAARSTLKTSFASHLGMSPDRVLVSLSKEWGFR